MSGASHACCPPLAMSVAARYRHGMSKRRRDRWATGPAVSLPEAAYGGPVYDLTEPDPVLAWVTFPDRVIELEARVLAHTDCAALVEWGYGQAAECAWLWRDAVRGVGDCSDVATAHRARLADGFAYGDDSLGQGTVIL